MEFTPNDTSFARKVAFKFTEIYYNHVLKGNTEKIFELYRPEAVVTRRHPTLGTKTLNGAENFKEELKNFNEGIKDEYNIFVTSIDAQPSLNHTFVVNVVVILENNVTFVKDTVVQTFVLSQTIVNNKSSFHIVNDFLSYVALGSEIKETPKEPAPKKVEEPAPAPIPQPVEEKPVVKEEPVVTKPPVQTKAVQPPQQNIPAPEKEDIKPTSWANILKMNSDQANFVGEVITKPPEDEFETEVKSPQNFTGRENRQRREDNRDAKRGGPSKTRGGYKSRGGQRRNDGKKPTRTNEVTA